MLLELLVTGIAAKLVSSHFLARFKMLVQTGLELVSS